jgi:four helix bundle protein
LLVRGYRDLKVFHRAFDVAMQVFRTSKTFPREERYSLTDQIRRSSRSVAANIAEAYRK